VAVAVVGAATPPELDYLAGGSRGQIHDSVSETARISAPGQAIAKRVAIDVGDNSVISIAYETSPSRQNIRKRIGADFDFEHTAIIADVGVDRAKLQIVVVLEEELKGAAG